MEKKEIREGMLMIKSHKHNRGNTLLDPTVAFSDLSVDAMPLISHAFWRQRARTLISWIAARHW